MDCCFLTDDYDYPEFYQETLVKARKLHQCCECGRQINKGIIHQKAVGKNDGRFWQYRTCLDCVNVRGAFSCGGFLFTRLWEDLSEYSSTFNMGCLDKISTASAKGFFLENLREWRGIA